MEANRKDQIFGCGYDLRQIASFGQPVAEVRQRRKE